MSNLFLFSLISAVLAVIAGTLIYRNAGKVWIFTFRILLRLIYRPKFVGIENIPQTGGCLLVCNHISLLDGFFLYIACPRNVRYVAHEAMVPKIFDPIARETGLIKISPGNPKNVLNVIRTVREALQNGEVVGIFPEGGITRNGQMKAFEPGFLSMLPKCGDTVPGSRPAVPIIPCHIAGLHESMFGYKYGEKTKLRPRKLLTDVIVSFGKPMYNVKYPQQVQFAVQELGVDSHREHNTRPLPLPAQYLIRTCKRRGNKLMFADSTGIALSGYRFLTAVFILRHLLKKFVLGSRQEEPHIGILAPMSVGGSLLNAALVLDRRVPVNLNFTFGADGINYCIRQAGIKHVLTSRKVLERLPDLKTKLEAEVFCSEDLLSRIKPFTKLTYLLKVLLLPKKLIEWRLGLYAKGIRDELITLIYTSGSTGQAKGVMLTNDNLSEVGRGFVGAMRLGKNDVTLGFLPFFHAFGLMGNFWVPFLSGGSGVFHFSPLEPKKVGEMARKYPCTFIASTPTFLRNFYRYCPKEDFENVPAVMCGAEKFPIDLIDAWHEKYGHRPGEGFGTTELSPSMSINIPEYLVSDNFHTYRKDGSIGRTLINVAVKIVDLETGADLPPNEVGMIAAKGPIVMKGYYKQPELTAEVIKDGWYTTGDVGRIDEDGFIWVTGRQSRISKIGGEMVPHILIEEEIAKILSTQMQEPRTQEPQPQEPGAGAPGPDALIAVTALPHPTRGEQIIVLYQDESIDPAMVRDQMMATNLPRLWIPHLDGFIKVDAIPVLGTGKLDLAAVNRKAKEHWQGQ